VLVIQTGKCKGAKDHVLITLRENRSED